MIIHDKFTNVFLEHKKVNICSGEVTCVLYSGLIIESILINDKITQPLGGRLNDLI